MIKQNMTHFIDSQNQKQLLMNVNLVMYFNQSILQLYQTYNLCVKKCFEEKYVDLLLIGEKGKRHYVFIKGFNRSMYNHTLHHRKNILALLFTSFHYKRNVKTSY